MDSVLSTRVIAEHPAIELTAQRNDHTRIWEIAREVETIYADGSAAVETVKSYIHEKGSGLCYRDATGNFVPSVPEWRETHDGFVIDRCAYRLSMGKTIGSAARYSVEGSDLLLCPAYLVISDGVNKAHLANLNAEAPGSIVSGSPCALHFPGAFGPGYDLEYVAEKGRFHQNVIIRQCPSIPAGFDASRATIFLYTGLSLDDYVAASGCHVTMEGQVLDVSRADFVSPASRGASISFRAAEAAPGGLGRRLHAFGVSTVRDCPAAGEVPKEALAAKWLMKDPATGSAYLVESLPFSYFVEETPGYPVVWDYTKISSDITEDATWGPGGTYWISSSISVSATLTIREGTVVKLNGPSGTFTQIAIDEDGQVLAEGQPGKYVIFTKATDNGYGESIDPNDPDLRQGQYGSALYLCTGSSANSKIKYCKMLYGLGPINCLESQNNAFEHNVIDGKGDAIMFFGIQVQFGASADCLNNLVYDSDWVGIKYYEAGADRISNNTIYGANAGIQVQYSDCDIITDNLLTDCSISGISLDSTSNNNLETLDYNGYWACATPVGGREPGPHDKILSACPYAGYGQFFLDQYCSLIDGGSRLASAAGLNTHTTSAGTNATGGWTDAGQVDIGYHYPHLLLKPYVQKLETYQDAGQTKARATIMWHTTASGTGYVDYTDRLSFQRTVSGSYTNTLGGLYIYEIAIDGLEPNALCYYRVRHGSTYSHDNSFYTKMPEANEFRFLVYGDNRGPDGTSFQQNHFKLLNSALANTWQGPRPRFVLHAADFVYNGGTAAQWHPHFFDPAAGLLSTTPLWPSLGNHDYGGDGPGNYRKVFSIAWIPGKPKGYPQERWYSFDYGGCHFTVLDTWDIGHTGWYAEGTDQWNWLKSDLEGSGTATWKFVLLHCPPYTHSQEDAHPYTATDVTAVRQELAEKVFNKSQYGVDAVFGGHNHFYEHSFRFYDGSETEGVHYIVTGGGGADGDHNPWDGWDFQNPPYQRVYADPDSPLNYFHYLTVDVPGGSGKPVLKHWRHQDGEPPALVETVTIGEPPPGW